MLKINRIIIALTVGVFVAICPQQGQAIDSSSIGTIPIIHCTDLFAPADDPDDYFDLAALYAVPEFDIRAVILDQGEKQAKRPGGKAVELLNKITGRDVPWVTGLSEKLKSPKDTGSSQPLASQAGVERIIALLQETSAPMTISVVGSARDLAAAYNRDPKLLKEKIRAVYVYCGDYSKPDYIEWNVRMDQHAYAALMRSDLPVVWIPCFDGGVWSIGQHNSYWRTEHKNLLGGIRDEMVPFFLLGINKSVKAKPVKAALELAKTPAGRDDLSTGSRNMWGGSLFAKMAGYRYDKKDDSYTLTAPQSATKERIAFQNDDLVGLMEIHAGFTDDGRLTTSGVTREFQLFNKVRPDDYNRAMTKTTAELLNRL